MVLSYVTTFVTFNIFFIGFDLWHLVHVYADRGRCYWDVLDTTPSAQLVSLSQWPVKSWQWLVISMKYYHKTSVKLNVYDNLIAKWQTDTMATSSEILFVYLLTALRYFWSVRNCALSVIQISLPWQQGLVVVKFKWHNLIVRPRKLPVWCKGLGYIYSKSRAIANFVFKFPQKIVTMLARY